MLYTILKTVLKNSVKCQFPSDLFLHGISFSVRSLIFLPHRVVLISPHLYALILSDAVLDGLKLTMNCPKASGDPNSVRKPESWISHPFINVSNSNYTWLATKLSCSFRISAKTQIQNYRFVLLLFSDHKVLYLYTIVKLCSLKVQIEKGIDCSFPKPEVVL